MSDLENMIDGTDCEIQALTTRYDPTGKPNSQRAIDEASANNLDVVFPAANELLIDIDNDASALLFEKHMVVVKKYIGVEDVITKPSRSGLPKRHITVKW